MLRLRNAFLLIAVVVCLSQIAVSQTNSQYELVKLVSERKKLMFNMQSAYLSLLAIRQGRSADLASAADHARSINEKIGMFVELLAPETATGQIPNSRAKPEIWAEPKEFSVAVEALRTTSAVLLETANIGDLEAFAEQFDAFTEACLGCHDLKPSSAGRFRSAK